ncbi:MAG: ThiF family adenylyltransferase [Parachlamydiales bacterium]|jgi:molybdopterin/thiamine biosynthesis adenylyltransferase
MDYFEMYTRNIGIFTKDEQNKLKNATVFFAGVGGVGGIQAVTLARMGLKEIIIMDPGVFDEADMNRQYGAATSSLGKNKAFVMGNILKDIAPFTKITVFEKTLPEKELNKWIGISDLVVDAIDLSDFKYKYMFARIAREHGKYNLSCPIPYLSAILMIFDPDGMKFEEFACNERYPQFIKDEYKLQFQREENINTDLPFIGSISTNSGAAALSGALLATEAALIITKKRKKEDLVIVPDVTYIDLFTRSLNVFNPYKDL